MATSKVLEVTLVNARHLPKMDTFGSCDGFCVFKFEGSTFRSTTVMKSYSPDWDETFTFQVPGEGKAVGKLDVNVFDWNRLQPEEKVGDASVDAETMNQIVHGVMEQKIEKTLTVYQEKKPGQPVKGKDKQDCEVKIILCVKAASIQHEATFARTNSFANRKTISLPSENPGAKGSRILEVSVLSAKHLPKMDTFGSCDPFCVLEFLDQEHTTPTKMNTYNATWEQSYPFYVTDVSQPLGVLKVVIMDWDRVGSNDKVGEVVVPTDMMQLISRAEVGWTGEGDFTVVGEDGAEVHGNDKQVCSVSVRILVSSAARGLEPPEPKDSALSGVRRLQITVRSSRHLPKMDTIGTCDAFCVGRMDGQEQKTTVKKGTYAPDWEEELYFYVAEVSSGVGELKLTVLDWDLAGANDEVGSVVIPGEVMSKVARAELGWEGEGTYNVLDDGRLVIGNDKEACTVTIKAKVLEGIKGLEPPEAAKELGGPRSLKISVMSANHLPKMDVSGSCDPYCVVRVGGEERKTQVKKGTYAPVWEESFSFMVQDSAEGMGEVQLSIMDWDMVGSHDKVGEVVIAQEVMSKVVQGEIGWEGEGSYCVKNGANVVEGNDKQLSVVTIKARVMQGGKGLEPPEPKGDAVGQRRLEVTVVSGRHLPKMDTGLLGGKVDAYVVVGLDGQEQKTSTKKGTYSPDWDESSVFIIKDVAQGVGDLRLTVMDWDMVGAHDTVGEVVVPSDVMSKAVQADVGWEQEGTYEVLNDGQVVEGNDKQDCIITLRVRIMEGIKGLEPPEPSQDVDGPRRVLITVVNARHLPKMDSGLLGGTCDAFCVGRMDGQEQKTTVKKGTYAPDWEEELYFYVAEVSSGVGELKLTVLDWDLAGANDEVGSVVIPGEVMSKVARAELGWEGEGTYNVMQGDNLVKGHDKKECTLLVRAKPMEAPVPFRPPEEAGAVQGPRRVLLSVKSSKHLPKMDLMGMCDPYCKVSFEGQELSTAVIKQSYNPEWNEDKVLYVGDAAGAIGDLRLTIMDWDQMGSHDAIGVVVIPAATMQRIVRAEIGWDGPGAYEVFEGDKAVVGHDGERSVVSLHAKTLEGVKGLDSPEPGGDVKGSRVVELSVPYLKHLPKMDSLLGKCDPYCKGTFQEQTQKTSVRKGTYNAEWHDELLRFFVEEASSDVGDLRIDVMDWDRMDKDDLVGSVVIPASTMSALVKAKTGWEGEGIYEVLGETGESVTGHDGSACVITIHARVMDGLKGIQPADPPSEAAVRGSRVVEVVVSSLQHLPKMDTMGKCDPFCAVRFEEQAQRTSVKKGTYAAEWKDEHLKFLVEDAASAAVVGPLSLQVLDWDMMSKSDTVGEVSIPAATMQKIVRSEIGWEGDGSYYVANGKQVVDGEDKEWCSVAIRVKVSEGLKGFEVPEPTKPVVGTRRIEINVLSARHLPKVDTVGSCDPFCSLVFEGQTQKTSTKKGTYSPDWDERSMFYVMDAAQELGDLVLTVFDWDMLGSNDEIGSVVLPGPLMTQMARNEIGWTAEGTYYVCKGKQVVEGEDKEWCIVKLRAKVLEGVQGFDPPGSTTVVNDPRRVELTVVSARHLPKVDTLGSCDAFCQMTFEGQTQKSSVKKGTYDPAWDEAYMFYVLDASVDVGEFRAEVYDWDMVGKNDLVGEVVIPAEVMGRVVRSEIGWEGHGTYYVSKDKHVVEGHDSQGCCLNLSAKVMDGKKGLFPPAHPPQVCKARRVEVTVVSARHLPKMDMMGSCDPFVALSLNGQEHKTEVKKGTYSPDFEEPFLFYIMDASQPLSELRLEVLDHDLVGKNDKMGFVTVPGDVMSRVARADVGWTQEAWFDVEKEPGQVLVGHDKQASYLTLRVKVLEGVKGLEPTDDLPPIAGPRALNVMVVTAKHLPKMDLMGSVDPFCIIAFAEQEQKTQVKKGYAPHWDEEHWYKVHDASKRVGDLKISLMDKDLIGKNDKIGDVVVSGEIMSKVVREAEGWEGEATYDVHAEDGNVLKGKDGQRCVLTLRARMVDGVRGLEDIPPPSEDAHGHRRIEVTVQSARHLPKMDTLGSVDSFVALRFEGQEHRTETKAKTYSPDWNETFTFLVDDVSKGLGDLKLEVLDWDRNSKNDAIGGVVVPGEKMTRIARAADGWEGDVQGVVFSDKAAVWGHDKALCALKFKVKVIPDVRRHLQVTIVSARHLPKMDVLFGTCDAYCSVKFHEQKYKTTVKKNQYDAEWNESFGFLVLDPANVEDDLTFKLKDWDQTPMHGTIGAVSIPAATISEMLQREVGAEWSETYQVRHKNHDAIVSGHDKQHTELHLKFRVGGIRRAQNVVVSGVDPELARKAYVVFQMMDKDKSGTADESELKTWLQDVVGWDAERIDDELWAARWLDYVGAGVPFDPFLMAVVDYQWPVGNLDKAEAATGSGAMWQLTLKVVKALHLPKTDLLGGVDPYVEIRFQGQKYKTSKQKNTYDPLWDPPDEFIFDIHDPDAMVHDDDKMQGRMALIVKDWDRFSKDDAVGGALVDVETIQAVLREGEGHEQEVVLSLHKVYEGDGGKLKMDEIQGQDHERSSLVIQLVVSKAPDKIVVEQPEEPVVEEAEVEVEVEEEEEEEVQVVDLDAVAGVCLCWRACDQIACESRMQVFNPGGDARPRFTEMVCPVLLRHHLEGRVIIRGL